MYCKRSNSTHLQISAPPPLPAQNNFSQLLANVHDTPDMTVPKTFGKKNKQKNYNQPQENKEEETRKQEKNNKRKGK